MNSSAVLDLLNASNASNTSRALLEGFEQMLAGYGNAADYDPQGYIKRYQIITSGPWIVKGLIGLLLVMVSAPCLACHNREHFPSLTVGLEMALFAGTDTMIFNGLEISQDYVVKSFLGYVAIVYGLFGVLWLGWALCQNSVVSLQDAVIQQAAEVGEKKIEATNIYQDFTKPWARVVIVFGAQTMLVFYFFMGLLHREGPMHVKENTYMFWFSSMPIQFIAASQMGKLFFVEVPFWKYVIQNTQRISTVSTSHGSTTITAVYPSLPELWLRCVFSMFANNIYYMIIIYGLPMQLMCADNGMDFVKDTFAIAYVATLDDLPETSIMHIIAPASEQSDRLWP